MMRYHFFDHYSRGGKDIGERVKAVGYSWATVGENLARGQVTIVEVIAGAGTGGNPAAAHQITGQARAVTAIEDTGQHLQRIRLPVVVCGFQYRRLVAEQRVRHLGGRLDQDT